MAGAKARWSSGLGQKNRISPTAGCDQNWVSSMSLQNEIEIWNAPIATRKNLKVAALIAQGHALLTILRCQDG